MAFIDGPPVRPAASEPLGVPEVDESEMWTAELAYLPAGNAALRRAQFAIRTAVRAQALARLAGTQAIDELLDARALSRIPASRLVYETAIAYLRRERELERDCRW